MPKLASSPTTAGSALRWKSFVQNATPLMLALRGSSIRIAPPKITSRSLAQVRDETFSDVWFTPAAPLLSPADELLGPGGSGNRKPPDERTVKLGKSMYTPFLFDSKQC